MKTKTLLFILLLVSGMVSAQVKRVAILETVDRENKVSYANKLILRANLSKAITQTSGYEAYDRTDIDAIMGEQNFQRTGLVSNDQIKRLGEMTGANYILVAEAVVVDSKNMFITAKLLDVETARTIMTDNLMMGTSADAIQEGCMVLAKKLFHEEVKKEVILVSDNDEAKVETLSFEDKLVRHTKQEQKMFGMKKYSYGNTQMDEKAFRIFMQKNDREAYLKYMQSQQLIYAGWGTMIGGALCFVAMGVCIHYKSYYGDYSDELRDEYYEKHGNWYWTQEESKKYDQVRDKYWDCHNAWISMVSFGGAAIISSIPILCVGYHRNKSVINDFNEQNSVQEPKLSLNLQASQNGIGLALSF